MSGLAMILCACGRYPAPGPGRPCAACLARAERRRAPAPAPPPVARAAEPGRVFVLAPKVAPAPARRAAPLAPVSTTQPSPARTKLRRVDQEAPCSVPGCTETAYLRATGRPPAPGTESLCDDHRARATSQRNHARQRVQLVPPPSPGGMCTHCGLYPQSAVHPSSLASMPAERRAWNNRCRGIAAFRDKVLARRAAAPLRPEGATHCATEGCGMRLGPTRDGVLRAHCDTCIRLGRAR